MNQTIIQRTAELLPQKQTLIDTAGVIVETQWFALIISFVLIPFFLNLILIMMINNKTTVKNARFNIILVTLLSSFLSVLFYLILISTNFTFIKNLTG